MKVFAINLASQTEKKAHILNECARHGIDVEIFDAINGKELSEKELQEQVYDYPACHLTRGEIGCALSHISIYQRMVEERHPLALILEDDAILGENITSVLQAIKTIENDDNVQPRAYLLSPSLTHLDSFKKQLNQQHTLNRVVNAHFTYAYVLNLAAAKALASFLMPVRYEADRWAVFQQMGLVEIHCIVPAPASTNDEDKAASDIENERAGIMKIRGDYLRQLRKKEMPFGKKLLRIFWKLLISMHLVKRSVNEPRK